MENVRDKGQQKRADVRVRRHSPESPRRTVGVPIVSFCKSQGLVTMDVGLQVLPSRVDPAGILFMGYWC